MTDFADLARLVPRHDPATCTRRPCRRCAGPHVPEPPDPVDHEPRRHEEHETSPFDPLIPLLVDAAPQAPTRLAEHMLSLATAISEHGRDRWARLLAWEVRYLPVSLERPEPVTDDRPPSMTSAGEREHHDNRRAGRYAQDARDQAARLTSLLGAFPASVHPTRSTVLRVRFLIAIAEARKPRQLKSRDLLASQAAADGWCRSCYRLGVFEPIATRPTGEPYYRDLCRWCGQNRNGATQPTQEMVRIHHRLPRSA